MAAPDVSVAPLILPRSPSSSKEHLSTPVTEKVKSARLPHGFPTAVDVPGAISSPAFTSFLEKLEAKAVSVSEPILDLVRERVAAAGDDFDEAFYLIDLGRLARQTQLFQKLLPRVYPHYAIKCNPNPVLVQTLALFGVGFDCASAKEIQIAFEAGATPEQIIYANPCKQVSALKYAAAHDVLVMTFDNFEELNKVKAHHPHAHLVLRIAVDDSQSVCQFNTKFGARAKDIPRLLETAWGLSLNVVGVSFHVGSGCGSVQPFADAIASARAIFDAAAAQGHPMSLLDIGGGFPGHVSTYQNNLTFENICACVNAALDQHFPDGCGVRIIAEPGRYFVAASHTLVTTVIAKRDQPDVQPGQPSVAYYISEGVYGSFNCTVFDHYAVTANVVDARRAAGAPIVTKLFGPTCDSIDCVIKSCALPELQVGDKLYFENMGAYTTAAASHFNGFSIKGFNYYLSQ
jgi:ornithine decarboxylase